MTIFENVRTMLRHRDSRPDVAVAALSTFNGFMRWARCASAARTYLEIGVETGQTLMMGGTATTLSVGVDPAYRIVAPAVEPVRVSLFPKTSDAFFADRDWHKVSAAPVDLTFVDGLHLCENALRDVLNAERLSHGRSLILVHDIVPGSAVQAARELNYGLWMGDVFRIVPALQTFRPDLKLTLVGDCAPSGMLVIGPRSKVEVDRPRCGAGLDGGRRFRARFRQALASALGFDDFGHLRGATRQGRGPLRTDALVGLSHGSTTHRRILAKAALRWLARCRRAANAPRRSMSMSIFGTIMSKVFGHGGDALPTAPASAKATNTASPASGTAPPAVPSAPSSETSGSTSTATPAAGGQSVDVAQVLDGMENKAGQTLDWRHSIVDLMKLLGLDSSLHARKELAGELHYTGDTSDSASMNMWLHKEVMAKFAANGGKLPSDLAQ